MPPTRTFSSICYLAMNCIVACGYRELLLRLLLLAFTPALPGLDLKAQQTPAESQPIAFATDIQPILRERCFACHGSLKQEAGLRLDTVASMQSAGVLVPGNAAESELVRRITAEEDSVRMPPEGTRLIGPQRAAIERWINQGAAPPANDVPEEDPDQHWSFQPLRRPQVPDVPCDNAVLCEHPIDAFINHRMMQAGVTPRPSASRETWLRRVTLDLTGIAPTPDEIRAFLADSSSEAYDRVVERLLSSPRYGERWGRHWMDIWRYADWFGRRGVPDVWNSAPQVWRWRDWIVRSLNDDVGYDRMVQSMLAADELYPDDPDSIVATGYLVRNWYALNPNDWMRNVVEHSGKAFLGLTFQCAHCHDHKYDPIRQEDYFALRAFFEPMYVRQDRRKGEADPGPFQDYEYSTLRKVQRLGYVSVFDHKADAPTWLYTGGDERNRQTDRGAIPASVPSFLTDAWDRTIEPVPLPVARWYPGLHPDVQATVLSDIDAEQATAARELLQARDEHARWESDPASSQERADALARESQAKQAYDAYLEAHLETLAKSSNAVSTSTRGLTLDARSGRRMIFNSLRPITPLGHGASVTFSVAPLTSAHLNVQLTRNNAQGLTATFVGFEGGKIKAYRPGTFDEFEVGVLPVESIADIGPIEVRIMLDREKDQGLLSLRGIRSDVPIVSEAPIALHGWDPANHPEQGILIDARSGAWGWFDDCIVRNADGCEVYRCDFDAIRTDDESSESLPNGTEIVGHAGWEAAAAYCQAGGLSAVADAMPDPQRDRLREGWEQAERVAQRRQLALDAAVAKSEWLAARRADWIARTNAEQCRHRSGNDTIPPAYSELARAAHAAGYVLQQKNGAYQRAKSRAELALAESLGSDVADRDKKQAAARTQWLKADREWQRIAEVALDPSAETYEPLSRQYPRTSSGRRAALAAWITSPRNPLTARVAVNHIWTRHFHQPLVATVYDLGRNGARPTHPELLDWLALEFVESGWSMKHLHRLIVTSHAYRRVSSAGGHPAATMDPSNRWLWRMNAGRMEAEVVRDSVLAMAGQLDETLGGQELENTESLITHRRSIYYSCQPEDGGMSPLGALFDGPDANDCYRRTRTIIPQQSLALTNSDWVHRMSQEILKQVDAPKYPVDNAGNRAFVEAGFFRILGRAPREDEWKLSVEYLERAEGDARASLLRALINHNDFVTIR